MDRKRKEAEVLQLRYEGLTPQQKIAKLDRILGEGIGAKKQRAKLLAQLTQ
jgi:hypothetical protein